MSVPRASGKAGPQRGGFQTNHGVLATAFIFCIPYPLMRYAVNYSCWKLFHKDVKRVSRQHEQQAWFWDSPTSTWPPRSSPSLLDCAGWASWARWARCPSEEAGLHPAVVRSPQTWQCLFIPLILLYLTTVLLMKNGRHFVLYKTGGTLTRTDFIAASTFISFWMWY